MSEPIHTPTVSDYNKIARECADLRDSIEALRSEQVAAQAETLQVVAEIRLASGVDVQAVTDEVYEDAYKVLDAFKDRCWSDGYEAGLWDARAAVNGLGRGVASDA